VDLASTLAALNATLNGSSAVALTCGFVAIKRKKVTFHRNCMITAFGLSVIFLISYITRFSLSGVHRYSGEGFVRTLYLSILITHTSLAAVTPFLAVRTLYLAARKRFDAHRRIARWTLPIWMYVSVTGVVVYLMLYQI